MKQKHMNQHGNHIEAHQSTESPRTPHEQHVQIAKSQ